MAYTPTNWQAGDVITAVKLNNMESGIADCDTAISDLNEDLNGWSDDTKTALLNAFAHVAWTDEHGQDYIDALTDALYPDAPPATLESISCVYTQSGTVYDTDSLDSLKSDLVVTAHYSDSTTETVASYTLSGTLAGGTSTITVSYDGKTTTFTVNVTSWTWKYRASDGATLSERTDLFNLGTQSGTVTEAVENGTLHLTAQNDGALRMWKFNTPTTNTDAVMEMRIKYSKVAYAGTYTNMQIQLSNGTGGAKVGATRINDKTGQPKHCTISGTTVSKNPDITIDEWMKIRIILHDGKQTVLVNDTAVITDEQNLCTDYCTYNRILLQAPDTPQSTISEVYVDYIAYKSYDV